MADQTIEEKKTLSSLGDRVVSDGNLSFTESAAGT